jgi:SAM-dependent methyltransferase
MRASFSGSGPGTQASDGCSVELYRRLPYFGELDAVLEYLPYGARVLELGCGTGRLTRKLLEWGTRPTSVDNSPEMLAGLPSGATPILGDIESLALEDRFEVVVLASCLINHPSASTRNAFAQTAARHLTARGRLLIERHDPQWLCTAAIGTVGQRGGVKTNLEWVQREADVVNMRLRYSVGDISWIHSFSVTPLTEPDIEGLLSNVGFASFMWCGARRRWVAAST